MAIAFNFVLVGEETLLQLEPFQRIMVPFTPTAHASDVETVSIPVKFLVVGLLSVTQLLPLYFKMLPLSPTANPMLAVPVPTVSMTWTAFKFALFLLSAGTLGDVEGERRLHALPFHVSTV